MNIRDAEGLACFQCEQEEVWQLLQYINALLRELLPSKSISSGERIGDGKIGTPYFLFVLSARDIVVVLE